MGERNVEGAGVIFHNRLAGEWEQKYQKRSFRLRAEHLLQLLDGIFLNGVECLDAGCGTGHLAREVAKRGCRVHGVDAAPAMVAAARKLAAGSPLSDRLRFETIETVERLPMGNSLYDGVLCASVLEYLRRPEACLSELRRVLKPGGFLLISVPNQNSFFRRALYGVRACTRCLGSRDPLGYMTYSINQYSLEIFSTILKQFGFTTVSHNFAGTPLPAFLDRSSLGGSLINVLARKFE